MGMDSRDNCKENGSHLSGRQLDFDSHIDLNTTVEVEGNEDEAVQAISTNQKVDSIHSRMRKELIPEIDMEFETEDGAYSFYKKYACQFGFGIRKSKSHNSSDGKLRDRIFVCSAEGKREQDKRDAIVKSHRAETRFDCRARMKINIQLNGKYSVVEFVPDHTHVTASSSTSYLHRSHRKRTLAHIAQADMANSSGIAPKETFALLSRQAGGRKNLGFIPDDYRNYLRSKRTREMKSGDTGGVLEYLQKMQLNDPNFLYAIQVDRDDLITNIFWADARMMVDYDYFGDVVCFDTTYRKNKDGRPFAMFVGVNNHKQSVIFGAALLYDDTAETFKWLFDTFAMAMGGKRPKSIFTDQDDAMAKALASQWPDTCHRLCIWHIYQNAAKKLSHVFAKFKDFAKEFSSCVYDYEDEDDFLNAWNIMLRTYDLQDNDWLHRMFGLKEKWALVYGREIFCADIISTQRSESMNNIINKYVNYKYDLLRFFEHFQRSVDDRRYEELRAKFRETHSSPSLSFPVKIMRHASKIYTRNVLKIFQGELCKAHDCAIKLLAENGTVSKYELMPHGKRFHHTVTFDSSDNTVLCSCKKFEFAGILCAHALKVLSTRNVWSIPTQYIMKRWRKDVEEAKSAKVASQNSSEDDQRAEIARCYREICRLNTLLATRASENLEAYEIALLGINKTLTEVGQCFKRKTVQEAPEVISPEIEINNATEPICIDDDNCRVRGIKTKPKLVCESSVRPRGALEKLAGNKRQKKELQPSSDSIFAVAEQSQLSSTLEVQLAAQSPLPLSPEVEVAAHSPLALTPEMEAAAQCPSYKGEVVQVINTNQKVDSIHSRMQKELIPEIGVEFETEEDAYSFYKKYACQFGFSIRKSKSHNSSDGKLRDRIFVCSAEGKREQDKRDAIVKSHRPETRFDCQARMKINIQLNGKYSVVEFVPDHTHVTSSSSKSHLHRSHRKRILVHIAQADMADSSGIAPKETFELLSRQAGGRENLGFIPDDYRNYLRSKRTREMKSGDTGGVLEYLQKMQLNDSNFLYAIQVDRDDLITNIFWADARMMVDYDYFGDVVCFDTTYRKNKDGRPFAMFVGVNNHKQSVIFGAALLYDDTAETFKWLFDTFAMAMGGKRPKSIFTDQDAAMAKALASQWPDTCHRLCIWHIYQNAAKKLSHVFAKFKDFAKDFSSCVYDYEDEDDFLNAWNSMLRTYDLQDNDWLHRLFGLKEKWALVYGREIFCADIMSTQRSESMNNIINKYVNYKYDFLRFFEHFQRSVDDRRYEELRAEFRETHSSSSLSFPVKIMRHASKVYTRNVLKMFQGELCKAHDCAIKLLGENGTVSKYELMPHGKRFHHTVTFDSSDNTVLCSCKKFEFAGILCAHALKVLSTRNVWSIPTQYIMKRWRKDVEEAESPKVASRNSSEDDQKAEIARHYREICRLNTLLATRASENPEAYEIALLGINKTLTEVNQCFKRKTVQEAPQVISPEIEINNATEPICFDDDNCRVRGIKTKPKLVGESSVRPRGALENLMGNKRQKKELQPSSDFICAAAEQSQLSSTLEVQLAAQSSLPLTPEVEVAAHSPLALTPEMEAAAQCPTNKDEVVQAINTNQKVDSIHSRMQKELIPEIGMKFETEDDAYSFYNKYACQFGFGIRKSKSHNSSDGKLRDRIFVCSAEGKREQDKRDAIVKSHRAETRFECRARMKINIQLNGKYSVVEFVPDHTHVTSSPSKSHLHRSHRKTKPKVVGESSVRPRGALEKLMGNKRQKKELQPSSDSICAAAEQSQLSSTLEVQLAAQSPLPLTPGVEVAAHSPLALTPEMEAAAQNPLSLPPEMEAAVQSPLPWTLHNSPSQLHSAFQFEQAYQQPQPQPTIDGVMEHNLFCGAPQFSQIDNIRRKFPTNESIVLPPQMQFRQPFQFVQPHYLGGYNTGRNYQSSSPSIDHLYRQNYH